MLYIKNGDWTLRNIKSAGGEETPRFEAKLYRGERAVAIASNGGHGGCCMVHWIAKDEDNRRGDRRAWEDHIAAQPALPSKYFPDGLTVDEDLMLYSLLDRANFAKRLKRSTFATIAGRDGVFTVSKYSGTPKAGWTVLNDMPFDDAFRTFAESAANG